MDFEKYLSVRITEEDRDLIDKVSVARGESASDFVRKSIRRELARLGFYSDETKRALGV